MAALTNRYVNEGIDKFKGQSAELASLILDSNPLNTIASDYLNFLIDGNKKDALDLILEIVNKGISIKDIYLNIFQATQKEAGRLWQMGKITVAQEHFITAATQLIMSQLYPYLFSSTKKEKKIIVTCASGELHEIGARMVADLFEMDGWNSYFFGANTPQNSFISAIEVYKPEVIAISTTMTFNLSTVSDLINSVRKNPKTNYVKILVGGYPFNLADNLWQSVGADGHAMDALSAINLANEFLN